MNLNHKYHNSINKELTEKIKDCSTKDKSEGKCKESLENKCFIPLQKQQIRNKVTIYA